MNIFDTIGLFAVIFLALLGLATLLLCAWEGLQTLRRERAAGRGFQFEHPESARRR